MRVAALYDIHGNLPALEAVLEDVRQAGVDQVVVGGDAVPGPMPLETLHCLLNLDLPVQFIHGNCELALLSHMAAIETGAVTYWGTTSGAPLPEPFQEGFWWTARLLQAEYEGVLAEWPKTLQLEIDELGEVLFCHGTPRSESEVFTRLTPEAQLTPLFECLRAAVVVCGHTHMQFERRIGRKRVVNAGSVGQPFGDPAACWALLGPGIQLRRTAYDLQAAVERLKASQFPQIQESIHSLLQPPVESEMLQLFGSVEVK